VGKATRAISDNPQLASASGINVDRVIRIVWILAGVLAALSGILWAYFRPGVPAGGPNRGQPPPFIQTTPAGQRFFETDSTDPPATATAARSSRT